jgi:hypothetical protein
MFCPERILDALHWRIILVLLVVVVGMRVLPEDLNEKTPD